MALKLLMGAVAVSGAVVAACFRYINVAVLNKQDAAAAAALGGKPKKKKKPSMG